ncbi:hypothetical protein QUA20_31330 [Microcoleus sp. Pol7_A1]|uniref:hypothetical protein n=1 Tax=Microcoleus sp. Pol7_A1 TaxID=2818893 RepID=UPI002FD6FDD4
MARSFQVLVSLGYLAAIGSGVFLGLVWCGGYVWHEQLAFWTLAAFAAAILTLPPYWTPRIRYRILLAALLPVLFLLSQALASPFYLGFGTASEYFAGVVHALRYGPC